MTDPVSKSAKDTAEAVEGSLEDNAKLYKLLEKYDEKVKAESV